MPIPQLDLRIFLFLFCLGSPGPIRAGTHMGRGHMARAQVGPGPSGPGPKWARAQVGQAPSGPGPKWAQAQIIPPMWDDFLARPGKLSQLVQRYARLLQHAKLSSQLFLRSVLRDVPDLISTNITARVNSSCM